MNTLSRLTLVLLAATSLAACDFLEQTSESDLEKEVIFSNDQGVEAAIAGAYERTQDPMDDYVVFSDLAADFAQHTGSFPSWTEVDSHLLTTNNAESTGQYIDWFELVDQANQILDNVGQEPIEGLLPARATEIVGEAYFFRAFAFHNLTKWFGAIPLPLTTVVNPDDQEEITIARSSVDEVYAQILSDLDNAASRVADERSVGLVDADVVTALRARVLLYDGQYEAAADAAESLEARYPLVPLTNLYNSLNSQESIWELQYNVTDGNSMAFFAFRTAQGGRFEYGPTPQATALFTADDGRRPFNLRDIGGTIIGKYFRIQDADDHHFVFRGAEMLLIRAEAAARRGDTEEAVELVNRIRARAGVVEVDDEDIDSGEIALDLVLEERARELAYEGHRWHDLVRTGRAVATLDDLDREEFTLWPIPQRELDVNGLLTQNPGY